MADLPPRIAAIVAEEAARHDTDVASILGQRRHRHILAARVACLRRTRAMGHSLPAIGLWFGLHHTTVFHHVKTVSKER